MYPNLYYVFSDLFGIEISFLKLINSFGFFVAMAFVTAGFLLKKEFTRLTNEGIFSPTKTQILVGEKASTSSIISQSAIGFIFGWKFLYLAINANELFQGGILPQTFLFSLDGSVLLGILGAISMGGWHWWDSKKNELSNPQLKDVDVHPSEHIGSILTVAAVGGILGAKLFHLIEYPDQFVAFIKAPSLNAFLGGLTIYGGLIVGGISVWLHTRHLGLSFLNVADTAAPSLMLGYGVGRIGCQVSGDGDWGIVNSNPQPEWLSWLPEWTWSYSFPNNVNQMGRLIKDTDPWSIFPGYGTCLTQPVYPTSLYETTMAIVIFAILWSIRKKFTTAGVLFSVYLIFNGFERFWIEKIRVNTKFELVGIEMTQAELISVLLMLSGVSLLVYLTNKRTGAPA